MIRVLLIAVPVPVDTVVIQHATMARTVVHAQRIVAPVRTDIAGMVFVTMGKTATVVLVTVDLVLLRNIVGMVSATTVKCAISALIVGCALHLQNIVATVSATTGKRVIRVRIVGHVLLIAELPTRLVALVRSILMSLSQAAFAM